MSELILAESEIRDQEKVVRSKKRRKDAHNRYSLTEKRIHNPKQANKPALVVNTEDGDTIDLRRVRRYGDLYTLSEE